MLAECKWSCGKCKKTHYMVFHRAKIKAVGLPVIMQRNVVECVTRTKFLGVIIDNKLKWNDHNLC